jgi:intracellular septation protein
MTKFLFEIIPVLAFLLGYKTGGIQIATLWTLVASIISIAIYYIYYRKVQNVALISLGMLILFSAMTLLTGDSTFIKLKPTILYSVFSVGCFWSSYKNNPLMKHILGNTLSLKNDEAWKILGYRFSWFFIFMAVINEIVWRNFEEVTWVQFKVFGALPLILIFIAIQVPFLLRNQSTDKD